MLSGRSGGGEANRSCEGCAVRASAICCSLDPVALDALSRLGRKIHVLAGQTLVWEGDESILVGNVLAGMLKLSTVTGDGREQIVGIVYPSDFIGRPFGRDSHHSVTALTDASLCVFGRSAFDRFAHEHGEVEHALLARTLVELDRARHWMLLLGRKSACERVASLILEMSARLNAEQEIALPLSRQQMADVLGLTIETVSRSLTKLKHAGIISLPGTRRLTIDAPDKLKRIADG
ncbi:helix-turn-helix domain-containing protein [Sphingomonadaceae bacterium G21617-S1]|jgi:CRP/FNR family transcriptional regulator|uniref:Crp/Fnr family transcriptional regulator n=1 Tax=Rhizorhabdus sp. TaxID=1968843 RepID=UPI0022BEAEFE|nr:helix-turn-helix domain-containing protein [Rhizorhabdus sp.]MCZ4341655.1 helix-turn-helix domain-containing protein [Sphingomonadaceae bacterium G21617-S1]